MNTLTPQQLQLLRDCARDDDSFRALVSLFHQQNDALLEALEQQQARYQAIVEQQTELICRYTPELILTFVNEAYCRFYNQPAQNLVGRSFLPLLDASVRDQVQQNIRQFIANPSIATHENPLRRHDGEVRQIQWVHKPIFNSTGQLIEVQAVGRDVTDQRAVEAALDRSMIHNRRLLEASPEGVMITSNTIIRYANPALVRLLGADSADDLCGRTIFELLHPDYHDVIRERINALGHDHEEVTQRRERYVRLDGSPIDVEISLMPYMLDDGQPASVTFVRDISHHMQTEQALEAFQDKLRALQRLSIDLSKADSFDALCYQAVEEGCLRLGFDRLGLWFLNEDRSAMVGSYGTGPDGAMVDERDCVHAIDSIFRGAAFDENHSLSFENHVDLLDGYGNALGKGWNALTALWNGSEVIGFLSADNFINRQPAQPEQLELLVLYGATLGHLASRVRIEETLRESEEAERQFQKQLRILHEVSIELTKTTSFRDLCRRAVELASERLDFDRIAFWFIDPENPQYIRGTFGIDEDGRLRDESDARVRIPHDENDLMQGVLSGKNAVDIRLDAPLYSHLGQPVGRGWVAAAALRDGEQVIGCLFADNVFSHQPPGRYTLELLRLYGATMGHLAARKWADEALQRSEKRYRAVFEGAGIGICIVNGPGHPISFNPAFQQLLGYSEEELRQKTVQEFTHPDDREENMELYQKLLSGELPHYHYEKRYLLSNGSMRWVRVNASPFPGADPEEKFIIAIVEDIDEHKIAEARLRESEMRFRQIAEHVDEAFFIYDLVDVKMLYINPAIEKMWQLPYKDLISAPGTFVERINTEDYPAVRAVFNRVSTEKSDLEFRITRSDGAPRWIWGQFFPIRDDQGQVYRLAGILKDVTERRQMEQQNMELSLQSERIRIISDFIRDASHQFRTPLSVINSKVYLASRIEDAQARAVQLQGIQEQSENILKLVESLVSMSRLDSEAALSTLPLSLDQMLHAIHMRHQALANEKNIRLIMKLAPGLPPVQGDVDELYAAIAQLLENAIRYTPDGGEIVLRSFLSGTSRVAIEVEDTGSGIEATDLPRIFDRFYRGQYAYLTPGFGLGLPLVKKVVERHGGHVQVKSQVGQGSTFTILLPVYVIDPTPEAVAQH